MLRNYKLSFELIRVSIQVQDKLSKSPSIEEWQALFDFAISQTLVGVLFKGLERLPKEQYPPKAILFQWFTMARQIQELNSLLNKRAVEICRHLKELSLDAVILKGQGIATYYPSPASRTPGDIDIWVSERLETILGCLHNSVKTDEFCYHHFHYHYFSDTEVEFHYRPSFCLNPIHNYRLQEFFKKTYSQQKNNEVVLCEGKICMPTIEFNRFYILQHIYRHLFNEGIGLRQLMDYYFVLKKGGTLESKKRTMILFRQIGMFNFVGATMWVMQYVFGLEDEFLLCEPNEKEGRYLLDEVMRAGNFGKYDERMKDVYKEHFVSRVFQSVRRNVRFLSFYPQEVFFDVPFRTWHHCWRKFHGWI